MADEAEFFAVVEAEKERAEFQAACARLSPTADDGVHGLRDFQFEPTRAAVADIRAVEAFGDDALEAVLPRQFKEFLALLQLMIGIAERGRWIKKPLQELFALEQRSFAQVESIAIKKVEYEINDRSACDEFFAGCADVHAFLEKFEITQAGFL